MLMVAAAIDVVTATVVVLIVLGPPLWAMLLEACVLEHRARFWMRVSLAELIAGTAFCASTSLVMAGLGSPWLAAAALLRGGFTGLLVSIAAITAGALVAGRSAGAPGPGAR